MPPRVQSVHGASHDREGRRVAQVLVRVRVRVRVRVGLRVRVRLTLAVIPNLTCHNPNPNLQADLQHREAVLARRQLVPLRRERVRRVEREVDPVLHVRVRVGG